MSQILKANQERERIGILQLDSNSYSLEFQYGRPTELVTKRGERHIVSCLNCVNPKCMKYAPWEIKSRSFPDFSYDVKNDVCPVEAISVGKHAININDTNCFGCGLCVSRCPFGAIHLKNGKASLNDETLCQSNMVVDLEPSPENVQKQCSFLREVDVDKQGCIREENDTVMNTVYTNIRQMSQEQQNILARNLLIGIGCEASLTRQGVVYLRMDGCYKTADQMGVLEIETGSDMLAVSRSLLDDIAVVNSRYDISPKESRNLAIVLSLPNKRTDYWQVVKDIKIVTDIKISTLTFGALLLFLWNNEKVSNFDKFYIDVDNSSIRKQVEDELGMEPHIGDGFLGILENSK